MSTADNRVHALDDYYLSITLLITIAYQLAFFSIAWTFKFDKLTGNLTSEPPSFPGIVNQF